MDDRKTDPGSETCALANAEALLRYGDSVCRWACGRHVRLKVGHYRGRVATVANVRPIVETKPGPLRGKWLLGFKVEVHGRDAEFIRARRDGNHTYRMDELEWLEMNHDAGSASC